MRESTKRFMDTMDVINRIKKWSDLLSNQYLAVIEAEVQSDPMLSNTPKAAKIIEDMKTDSATMSDCVDYNMIEQEYGALYEKYYTEDELNELADLFENNSILRKMRLQEDALNADATAIGQRILADTQERFAKVGEALGQLAMGKGLDA